MERTSSVTCHFLLATDRLNHQHIIEYCIQAEPRHEEWKFSLTSRCVSDHSADTVLGACFLTDCLKTSSLSSLNVFLKLLL